MRRIEAATPFSATDPVGGVARRALSVLSQEIAMQYPDTSQRLLVRFLEQLYAAVRAPGADPLRDVLDLMRRSGIRAADIADFYVPVVAHRLGQGWCDDTLDFVQVSLGCARLQSLLQRLDASWYCPDAGGFGTGVRLAVIVPRGEQHSLGAHILTGQLRRAGCAVDLLIDLDDAAIVHHLGVSAPDATLISASRWLSLDSLHTLVRNIRGARGVRPVLIGGSILDRGRDVFREVGADHAANDWQSAMEFCEQRIAR